MTQSDDLINDFLSGEIIDPCEHDQYELEKLAEFLGFDQDDEWANSILKSPKTPNPIHFFKKLLTEKIKPAHQYRFYLGEGKG